MPTSNPSDPKAPRPPGQNAGAATRPPNPPVPLANNPPTISPQGVVQGSSRWNRGAWLFRDSTLQSLETLLDEAFRVPGTRFRFGIDGVIGLVPGFGDVLAGLLSLIIPIAAWIRGVPYITLLRMVANVGIGVLVGSIPIFGDIFDIVWKANRRNYRLLTLHLGEPHRHTGSDWAFLGFLAAAIALIFAIPIVLILWFLTWLFSH